jgi:hypothetical protein
MAPFLSRLPGKEEETRFDECEDEEDAVEGGTEVNELLDVTVGHRVIAVLQ